MKRKNAMVVLGIIAMLSVTACGREDQNAPVVNQPDTEKQTQDAESTETVKLQTSVETESTETVKSQTSVETEAASSVDQAALKASYTDLIGVYTTALTEGWSSASMVENGLNPMASDCAVSYSCGSIGYVMTDLDQDGTDELAIAVTANAEDEFYGKLVLELYTMDMNGNAVHLFSSSDRNRYYYAGGNCFANVGSSSFDDSFETTVKLEGGELVDMTYTTAVSDYRQLELTALVQSEAGNQSQNENEAFDENAVSPDDTAGGASGETNLPNQGWNSVLLYDENMDSIEVTRGMDGSGNWYDLAGRSYGDLDQADSNAPVYREDGAVYYWNTDQANTLASGGQGTSAAVDDPYDLYSWDAGTNSYIPYQAADSSGTAIGRGNGWYYYDSQTGEYLPW